MFEYLKNLDETILIFLQEYFRNPYLTPMFRFFSWIGDMGVIWILLIIVLFSFKKYRNTAITALVSLALCFLINNIILKNIIARPRPFDVMQGLQVLIAKPTDFSFPSGHAASSFATAGAIFFFGNKKMGIGLLILAMAISFSRLYFGVHYPSDVIAGAILGLIISFLVVKLKKSRKY